MEIRHATIDDQPRIAEMTSRFLQESIYGSIFTVRPECLSLLIENCFKLGTIIVAERAPLYQATDGKPVPAEHLARTDIKAMSSTERAMFMWPEKFERRIVGMLAIVIVPHPLTGLSYAEELAWWVDPEHRNGLAGPKMLREAEAWATRNVANMVKMVAPAGTRVGEFYAHMGYTAVETAFIKRIERAGG